MQSCSGLFVCTAILCWDYYHLKYSFFNITKCTPKSIDFKTNLHLIAQNKNYSKIQSNKGFICSNCTRENFIENTSNQCYKQTTRIKLKNFCFHRQMESVCQCFPSNQSIEPITNWMKALVKPGKDLINTNRVNNINRSASSSVYILVGLILLLVLIGGIIGLIFYWIKFQSCQLQILK